MSAGFGGVLMTPNGFGQLKQGIRYRFLYSDALRERALLVWFPNKAKPDVAIEVLTRAAFESGLLTGEVKVIPEQSHLPPWLEKLKGKSITEIEENRKKKGRTKGDNSKRAADREAAITQLLDGNGEASILSADNPISEIRRLIKERFPSLNPSRAVVWTLTYLAFGKKTQVLYPAYLNNGRCPLHQEQAGGSTLPKMEGCMSEEDVERCQAGFRSSAKLGLTFKDTYTETLRVQFGCVVRKVKVQDRTNLQIFHPEGLPYPSTDQYRYRVLQKWSLETIQKKLYGAARVRKKAKISKGKMTEELSLLLQKIELDGYWVDEVPKPLIPGYPSGKLCVVRIACATSGTTVGFGFSEGSEKTEAYFAAIFCMAVGIDVIARWFGVECDKDDVPDAFLARDGIFDRGCASDVDKMIKSFAFREITPSAEGQSKASVESGHPKTRKLEGTKSHIQSDSNIIQLARRELIRAIHDNRGSDASGRLTPEMIDDRVSANPLAIWKWHAQRLRIAGSSIDIDEAVERFLKPITLEVKNDGIYFRGVRYDDDQLRRTNLLENLGVGAKVKGFCYEMLSRRVWIKYRESIVMVTAKLALNHQIEQLDVPISVVEERQRIMLRLRMEQRKQSHATDLAMKIQYANETGKEWHGGRRVYSRHKKSS